MVCKRPLMRESHTYTPNRNNIEKKNISNIAMISLSSVIPFFIIQTEIYKLINKINIKSGATHLHAFPHQSCLGSTWEREKMWTTKSLTRDKFNRITTATTTLKNVTRKKNAHIQKNTKWKTSGVYKIKIKTISIWLAAIHLLHLKQKCVARANGLQAIIGCQDLGLATDGKTTTNPK